MPLPVRQAQVLTVDIESATMQGSGVARVEGYAVFVPFALPGERCRIAIERAYKRYATARLLEVQTQSPARQVPPCPHYRACGGCVLQHATYDEGCRLKARSVHDCLRRIGRVDEPYEMLPLLAMDDPFRYRNKAEYAIDVRGGAVRVGFRAAGARDVVPVKSCLLQSEQADAAAQALRDWLARQPPDVAPRHLVVRTTGRGEALAVIVTAQDELPDADDLVRRLRAAVPTLRGVVQNIQPQGDAEVFGRENRTIWGEDRIRETIGGLTFGASALSFLQVNARQTERLYAAAVERAALTGAEFVVDAYCGSGTMALLMARRAGDVLGIESFPPAVDDARENARRNGIGNASFACGLVEVELPRLVEAGRRPDVVVLDPPRKGCDEVALDAIANSGAARVVYVSCDPATLSRDVARLGAAYRVASVQPVDMFPWTGHVETVCVLSKLSSI